MSNKSGAIGYPLAGGPPRPGAPPQKTLPSHMQAHEVQVPDMKKLAADGHRIRVEHEKGDQYNPTVCVDRRGDLRVVLRVLRGAPGTLTTNFTGRITANWALERPYMVGAHRATGQLEDMRLFLWKGALWATAVQYQDYKTDVTTVQQALVELEPDAGEVTACHIQTSPRNEKNWMPCVSGDTLRLIYSTDPLVVLDAHGADTPHVTPNPSAVRQVTGHVRGGSQLVPWREGWLAIVHQVYKPKARNNPLLSDFWVPPIATVYVHRFIKFDHDLKNVMRMSRPFFFHKEGIEFCAGLVRWQERFVASVGVADKEAWLFEIEDETVDIMMGGI
jgi:hypothetical protein